MLAIMEKYATRLELLVEERTQQLAEEKKKTETLLLTMLPKFVNLFNNLYSVIIHKRRIFKYIEQQKPTTIESTT